MNRVFRYPISTSKVNTHEGRYMDLLDSKTDEELHLSILAELAKASNELRCARADIEKVTNRLSFLLVMTNTLINRPKD